jgi:ribosomal-protein-alanine N-acetyltransferase
LKYAKILWDKQMTKLKQNVDYLVRLMEQKDIPQVIEIDREAFPTQWPHPTYASLKQELRNPLAHYIVACKSDEFILQPFVEKETNTSVWGKVRDFLIREPPSNGMPSYPAQRIIGMAGFWIMVGEAHITTVAIRNSYRRRGVGEWLLVSLIDQALQHKAEIVTLEVRVSNEQAQSLYSKYGFYQAGVRHKYYTDNGEDALIMTTHVITSAAFQYRFQELKRAYEQNM